MSGPSHFTYISMISAEEIYKCQRCCYNEEKAQVSTILSELYFHSNCHLISGSLELCEK